MTHEPTLPAFARAIAEHFPELNGRAFAAAEVDPFNDQTNKPTLPVAVVGLAVENGTQSQNGGNVNLSDEILVQFIFNPVRYTNSEGRDTPFWAFYDYEVVRDQLLTLTRNWRSPRNAGLAYRQLDVTADDFAVYLTFRFALTEKWCPPDEQSPIMTIDRDTIIAKVVQPRSEKPCCEPCVEPVDPCNAARQANPHSRENWDDETKAKHGPITE